MPGPPAIETEWVNSYGPEAALIPRIRALEAAQAANNGAYALDAAGHPNTNDLTAFGIFIPEKYGAATTYNAAVDDTAAVQAAITAAVAAKGKVYLSRMYSVPNGGLSASGPVTIEGSGGRLLLNNYGAGGGTLTALAGFIVTADAVDCLALNGPGSILRDFGVINTRTSVNTSGRGIYNATASNSAMQRVTVVGFFDGIETSGTYWTIDSCHVYSPGRYGIFLNNAGAGIVDHGDIGINNCVIAASTRSWTARAGIRWESGGGIRIVGCKIIGDVTGYFDTCIDIQVPDGNATGDLNIEGNSLSNFSVAAVRMGLKGPSNTGTFIDTAITGNQINVGTGAGVLITPTSTQAGNLKNIVISDNVFANFSGPSISANGCTNLRIGPNVHENVGSPVILLGAGAYGAAPIGVDYAEQTVKGDGIDIIQDWRSYFSTTTQLDGVTRHRYRRTLHITAANVWQTIGYIVPFALGSRGSGGKIRLTIAGNNATSGPVFGQYERTYVVTNNASTPTVATIGTDVTAGTGQWAVQFVTSTNKITVQVQVPTGASDTILDAFTDLEIVGAVNTVHKGA